MAIYTELGARPPGEESGRRLMVQATGPDQGGGDASKYRIDSPPEVKSILEQLMHNLMLALGAPPV